MTENGRTTAYQTLLRIGKDGAYSNIALSSAMNESGLTGAERAFSAMLVRTVIERQITIDYQLSLYLKEPLRKLRPEVCAALRLGAAQILFLDKIPNSAAVNETVRILKSSKKTAYAAGLCNAVLRKLALNGLCLPDGDSDLRRSIQYGCPVWLVRLWTEAYGMETADSIMASFLQNAPIAVRVNTLLTTTQDLLVQLQNEGVAARTVESVPHALLLEKGCVPETLASFQNGLFHVQGIASQLCCAALEAKSGDTIYDVCAAPGGKSFTIAQEMCNTGYLLSGDLYPQRVRMIENGAKRLHIECIHTEMHDASVLDERRPKADRVLCDVPCSGLGVIGKKPEIRFKDPKDIDNLTELQYDILCVSASYVRKGGRLVYSTCSLNPQENEAVVHRFLADHPAFHPVSLHFANDLQSDFGFVTLFPQQTHGDGFFVAAMTNSE